MSTCSNQKGCLDQSEPINAGIKLLSQFYYMLGGAGVIFHTEECA